VESKDALANCWQARDGLCDLCLEGFYMNSSKKCEATSAYQVEFEQVFSVGVVLIVFGFILA
jgi:hypothetical protein